MKEQAFFVRDAKTTRVRAGLRVKYFEQQAKLSRSTIGRIEEDAGTSEVSAWAYLNALRAAVPDYPFSSPVTQPAGSRVNVVKIDADRSK